MKRGVDAYASPIANKKILFCTVERTRIVTMLVATSKLLRVLPPSLYIIDVSVGSQP